MAKRVNTRFLILITAVFAVLLVGALAAHFLFFRKDAASQIAVGDQLMKDGKAKDALERYRFAHALRPTDKELLVKIGDAMNTLVAEDTNNLENARGAWNQAVAQDPAYDPALTRLLDSYWQHIETGSLNPALYSRVRDTAARLAAVRPADLSVQAKVHILTLRPWLEDQRGVVKPAEVDESIKALTLMMSRDRQNADVPYHVAIARLKKAQEARQRDDKGTADRLVAEAGALFDAILPEQKNNASMQLRGYQLYSRLDQIERANAAQLNAGRPNTEPADKEGPWGVKARAALAAAVEASKSLQPYEELYADVHIEAADFARRDRRNADAEKIYEDLLAKRPDDQNVRLRYARLLGMTPGKREKAVELLSGEVSTAHLTGVRGFEATQLKAATVLELVDTRIQQAGELRDSQQQQQRQEVIVRAKEDMKKLESLVSGDHIPVLRAKAKLQQLEGDAIGAIQTYNKAATLMEGSTNKDFNLINELAQALLMAGQTGSAKDQLARVIGRHEWFVPAQLQMAQILLAENKIEEAKGHVRRAGDQLARMSPDVPEYAAWRAYFDRTTLALLSKAGDDTKLNEQYAKMPEATRVERLAKAGIAQALKKYDETVRLAGAALKEDPRDLTALDALLNAYLASGRKEEALKTVDAALAAKPADDVAQRMRSARERIAASIDLANATPAQVYERSRQILEKDPESTDRSIKLADLDRQHGNLAQAEGTLLKVLAAQPNHVPALTRLMDLAIVEKNWDKAKGFLDRLVATKGDGANGLLYQFRFAVAKGDKNEAVRLGKAVRDARPEFDLGFLAHGQALQALERYPEAIAEYKQARDRKPLNFDALKGMVQCWYALSKPEMARDLINEARGIFPDNPMFKELELNHELRFGDPMTVVAEREAIQRQQPETQQHWLDLAGAYREAARVKFYNDPAKKAELLGKARDLLRQGLGRWKDDQQFVTQLASVLFESGDFAGGEKILKDYAGGAERAKESEPLLMLADYYLRGNKLQEAEAASRSALERAEAAGDAGTGIEIRLRLAEFLGKVDKPDDALAVLDAAPRPTGAAAEATVKRLFRRRLEVLLGAGRRADAEAALLDALTRADYANDPDIQMALVAVNYEGGRFDQALERVNNVLKNDPENLQVRFFRGQILLRKPRPEIEAAIAELNEVSKRDPHNIATRLLLAEAYVKTNNTPAALRELEEGKRLQPTSRDIRIRMMDLESDERVLTLAREARGILELKDDPAWAFRESLVHARKQDWAPAMASIEDAIKLAPKDMSLRQVKQNYQIQAKDFKSVLSSTDQMAKESTAPWWVFMNRGIARHGLKDDAGAVVEFNTAINTAADNNNAVEQIVKAMTATVGKEQALALVMSRAEKDPRWKLLAAALHSVDKDWANAVRMLDEVQANFNELTPAHQARALRIAGPLYQLARPPEFDKARKAYEQLLTIEPNDLFALNNLATLLIDDALVPQPQEARKYSEKAYEMVKRAQPFPAAIFDTHGWVLIQCGSPQDVDAGIDILLKVVRQSTLPEAHYHLGEGWLKKRDPNKALEEFRMAAQTIPQAMAAGTPVSPDLEKKIEAATRKAEELKQTLTGAAEAR